MCMVLVLINDLREILSSLVPDLTVLKYLRVPTF